MNNYESKTKEIAQSGLMIELDIPADGVLAIASLLSYLKSESRTDRKSIAYEAVLSQLIASLELNFPGTHELLFPDVQLINRRHEELYKMDDFDKLMEAIACDQSFIRFNTHAYRLFISTAYLQFGIRESQPSESDAIAIEIFNNQVACLEHYHP